MTQQVTRSAAMLAALVLLAGACNTADGDARQGSPQPTPEALETGVEPVETEPARIAIGDRIQAQIAVPAALTVAFTDDAVWVPQDTGTKVSRIDPATNEVVAEIDGVGRAPKKTLVDDAGRVWVASGAGRITVIDPATDAVAGEVDHTAPGMDFGLGAIWAADRRDQLLRIDPDSREIVGELSFGDDHTVCNNAVTVSAGAVWIDHCDEAELVRVDPDTLSVTHRVPGLGSVASDGETVAAVGQDGIALIDPESGEPTRWLVDAEQPELRDALRDGGGLVFHDGALWATGGDTIARIDLATGEIGPVYAVDGLIIAPGIAFGSLWVSVVGRSLVLRLDVL